MKGILGGHFIDSDTLGCGRTEYFENYKQCQYRKQTQTKMSLAFFAKRAKVWKLFQDENIGNGKTVRYGLVEFSTGLPDDSGIGKCLPRQPCVREINQSL